MYKSRFGYSQKRGRGRKKQKIKRRRWRKEEERIRARGIEPTKIEIISHEREKEFPLLR